MKIKLEFETTKSLSLGGEVLWDKRYLRQKDLFLIGIAILCFTVFIIVEK